MSEDESKMSTNFSPCYTNQAFEQFPKLKQSMRVVVKALLEGDWKEFTVATSSWLRGLFGNSGHLPCLISFRFKGTVYSSLRRFRLNKEFLLMRVFVNNSCCLLMRFVPFPLGCGQKFSQLCLGGGEIPYLVMPC